MRGAVARATANGAQAVAPVGVPMANPGPIGPSAQWVTWPWQGVRWNLSYVACLLFTFVSITYSVNLGNVAIGVGLAGLIFLAQPVRMPAPLLLFGGYVLVGAVAFSASPFKDYAQPHLQAVLKIWLILMVFYSAVRTREQVRFYMFFFLACIALYPVRGVLFNHLIYLRGWGGRIAWIGIFENPNDLAAMLFLPLGLCAGMLFTERRKHVRWAVMAGLGLIPFAMFLTQSRAGLLALGVFGLFAFFGHRRHFRAVLAAVVVIIGAVMFAPSGMWTRLSGLQYATDVSTLSEVDKEGSASQRYELWRVARRVIAANPVLGVGLGAYPAAHGEYARTGDLDLGARGRRDAHSTYLTVVAETGIPGTIFFFTMVITCLVSAERTRRLLKRLRSPAAQTIYFIEAALAAFAFSAIFGSYQSMLPTHIHIFLLWTVAETERRFALSAAGAPAASRSVSGGRLGGRPLTAAG